MPVGVVWAAAAMLVSGCAVGPDFEHPPPPEVGRYTREPLASRTSATPDARDGQAAEIGGAIDGGEIRPVDHVCVDGSRMHRVDADAVRTQLDGRRLPQVGSPAGDQCHLPCERAGSEDR